MATTFEEIHAADLNGSLTTVDRLIVHGHIRPFWGKDAVAHFLMHQGVHIQRGFGRYVHEATEKVRLRATQIARRAGRPFIYQDRVVRGKDDLARAIAARDGVKEGLICVIATVELANCFALCRSQIVTRLRKCLHLYFYVMDRELGFMHVRIQSWLPFQIQIYLNGHEWLARQLDRRHIDYRRYENAFLEIDDMAMARRLCARFARRGWIRTFDAFARRVNPILPAIRQYGFGSYYWSIDACEVSTDVMWNTRARLGQVLPEFFDHALRAFSADDVIRFLDRKRLPGRREIQTAHSIPRPDRELATRRRPECRRIKHRVGKNWIKMYDKWSVLRVETVINIPYDFRVLRFEKDRRGRRRGRWMRMAKGIRNLWRYIQVGEAANRRYLDALGHVSFKQPAIDQLDALCRPRTIHGRRHPRLNPVAASDCELFQAVLAGQHHVRGFNNHEIQDRLYPKRTDDPAERRRRCSRVYRQIAKLRGHGLIAKVPGHRRYRVTKLGALAMSAALRFRDVTFPQTLAA
jgi:hypothetical protein